MSQAELFQPMHADLEELLKHSEEVADDERAWPQMLAELVDVLADSDIDRGKSEEDAFKEARRTIIIIANYWGARSVYLPRNEKLRLALRDNQIWREFCRTGDVTALAMKHDLSNVMVYHIIKRQHRLTLKRKQCELFPESE
ncbi:MAG: Mor transcription activator family protein [Mariprofundaceae bacterium]